MWSKQGHISSPGDGERDSGVGAPLPAYELGLQLRSATHREASVMAAPGNSALKRF